MPVNVLDWVWQICCCASARNNRGRDEEGGSRGESSRSSADSSNTSGSVDNDTQLPPEVPEDILAGPAGGHVEAGNTEPVGSGSSEGASDGVVQALAVRRAVVSKVYLLEGWVEAKAEAIALRKRLDALDPDMLATPEYLQTVRGIDEDADKEIARRRRMRLFVADMADFGEEFECLNLIPRGGGTETLWQELEQAKLEVGYPFEESDGEDEFVRRRDGVRNAAKALMDHWEASEACLNNGVEYYVRRREAIWWRNAIVYATARQ